MSKSDDTLRERGMVPRKRGILSKLLYPFVFLLSPLMWFWLIFVRGLELQERWAIVLSVVFLVALGVGVGMFL